MTDHPCPPIVPRRPGKGGPTSHPSKRGARRRPRRETDRLRDEADAVAGAFFRGQARCAAAGHGGVRCSRRFEWCHCVSRGILFLRHHPRNAFCLCNAHHRHFTGRPNAWWAFVEEARPGTWDLLRELEAERRRTPVPEPLADVYRRHLAFYRDLAAPDLSAPGLPADPPVEAKEGEPYRPDPHARPLDDARWARMLAVLALPYRRNDAPRPVPSAFADELGRCLEMAVDEIARLGGRA